jgi:hypothetical protein
MLTPGPPAGTRKPWPGCSASRRNWLDAVEEIGIRVRCGGVDGNDVPGTDRGGQALQILDGGMAGGVDHGQRDIPAAEDLHRPLALSPCK